MKADTAAFLTDLNRQFYQTFALQFSSTRRRLQPGVRQVLESLPSKAHLLDLGSGNGEFARELLRRDYQGYYIGLDFGEALLEQANLVLSGQSSNRIEFQQADLTIPGWEKVLQGYKPQICLAFAVLHHIPGGEVRKNILNTVRALLPAGGQFIFSVWQFLNSPRLVKRIQPWEMVGLTSMLVEDGDYLIDWQAGGKGLRYVHHFNQNELNILASETGFEMNKTFYSDGENGKLGLYQVWTLC